MAHIAVRLTVREQLMPIEMRAIRTLLQVFDMPTSLRFYCDVLGFQVVQSSAPVPDAGWVWLRCGDVELMLNTAYEPDYRPAAPDPNRRDGHGDTGLYIECADVDAAYEHLRARGIDAKRPTVASYGMKQLYVADPDGYWLCFQCEG